MLSITLEEMRSCNWYFNMAKLEKTIRLFAVPPHHMRIGIRGYDGKERMDGNLSHTNSILAC